MEKIRQKTGPKVPEAGPSKRRSISMSDTHWRTLEVIAQKEGIKSISALVCKLIERDPRFSSGVQFSPNLRE